MNTCDGCGTDEAWWFYVDGGKSFCSYCHTAIARRHAGIPPCPVWAEVMQVCGVRNCD